MVICIPPLILLYLLDNSTTLAFSMTAITGGTGAPSSFALIPSQVPGARHRNAVAKDKRESALHSTHSTQNGEQTPDDSGAGDEVVYTPTTDNDDDTQSITPSTASVADSTSTTSSSSSVKKKQKKKKILSIPRTGNLPDVHWRAITMSHLRSHPNFQPLPPPSMITTLPTKEHVRYFRQDSWQWDYLHTGRCTTSQTASALGFLEPKAASFLGIPRSLQRGGISAWDRLQQTEDENNDSLEYMNDILCEGRSSTLLGDANNNDFDHIKSWRPGTKESERLWIPSSKLRYTNTPIRSKPFPFTAKYIPNLTMEELYQRKEQIQKNHLNLNPSPMKTRMSWGNAQEATSILTALNYFCGEDNETMIQEVGMCGAGFDDNNEDDSKDDLLQGVKIGASPDALICHGNGTVEVLEVKNHCPFVWNRISPHYTNNGNTVASSSVRRHRQGSGSNKHRRKNQKGKKKSKHRNKIKDEEEDDDDNDTNQQSLNEQGKNHNHNNNQRDHLPKHYLIRDFQLERKIPPVYLPQLMMEMLCVGKACTSAIMVRQTATKGAILLRIQRDEDWINEMKYYLGKFQSQYVNTGIIPPDNFFYDHDSVSTEDKQRYHNFLVRTKELSESVEQVAYIDHGRIQRMVLERGVGLGKGGEIPLFLDRVNRE